MTSLTPDGVSPPAHPPDLTNSFDPEATGAAPGAAPQLRACRGPLVVVAGLPGAGKSTALEVLRGYAGSDRIVVVDSASVRQSLRAALPVVPYPVLRPVVHTVHWARVVRFALRDPRPLVVHETATRALSRWGLRTLARLGRRPARLVWLDVAGQVALAGQHRRGRVVRSRSFRRHLRRVNRRSPMLAAAAAHWDSTCRVDRGTAVLAIATACGLACRPDGSPEATVAAPQREPKATVAAPQREPKATVGTPQREPKATVGTPQRGSSDPGDIPRGPRPAAPRYDRPETPAGAVGGSTPQRSRRR